MRNKPNSINELKTLELSVSLYDLSVIYKRVKELELAGWSIYVVNQSRGVCHYSKKYVTIPTWVINKPDNYWIQYLAHELAHTAEHTRLPGMDSHGLEFMEEMKRLCPPELWFHELSYKPVTATLSGISIKDTEIKEVKLFRLQDAL